MYKCITKLFLVNSTSNGNDSSAGIGIETGGMGGPGTPGALIHSHKHVHFDSVEYDEEPLPVSVPAPVGEDTGIDTDTGDAGRKTRSYSLEIPHEATHLLAHGRHAPLPYPSQRKHVDKFDTLSARTGFIQTKLRNWYMNMKQNAVGHMYQILVQFKILLYVRYIESCGNNMKQMLNFVCLNWLFPFVAIYLVVVCC